MIQMLFGFQATLGHLSPLDIIQLKCMSGSSAVLQFTGPKGEKARVYFEAGQVRHATAPGKEGVEVAMTVMLSLTMAAVLGMTLTIRHALRGTFSGYDSP